MHKPYKKSRAGERSFELGAKRFNDGEYKDAEQIFRKPLQQREEALGLEDVKTLGSESWLARSLFEQKKYEEAEQLFRQSLERRAKVLGPEDIDTLDSEYWLAQSLFWQEKYEEAEQLFRRSVERRGGVLGPEDVNTLYSVFWLAQSLFWQEKYEEAEQLFRQSVERRGKVLAPEHIDTLDSVYSLARSLCEQEKYEEAEQLFRQSVEQRGRVLGPEDIDTLDSVYWLARSLLGQEKYEEAEQLFRQLVERRCKILGPEDIDTLDSVYWLARSLFGQKKYEEAEQLFRQSVERGKVLGPEDIDTLDCIYWLALTLREQQMYGEAEQLLRQLVQQREKILGVSHKDTLESKRALEGLPSATANSTLANSLTETVTSRLSSIVEGRNMQNPYTDSEIQQISLLLNPLNPQWSKAPRTYIILRTIGCLSLLDAFVDLGISDYWFPFTDRSLPNCLRPSQRSNFLAAQKLVITKSIDLEKGEEGQHCYFQQHEPLPLETKGIIGSGGFGQVDRVLSLISFREYARKRVLRSNVFSRRRREDVKQFITEIEIIKRLKHHHVVDFIGSYTDPQYIALLMSPVAEMDLSTYLTRADPARYRELRTFFGCLATALDFLHGQKIRHKDIKPGNILVHGGNILLTDFGLSFDFTDAVGSTTVSMVNGLTPRYCAPEVALHEPRNTSSDIWSLGVVFLEMVAVLKGRAVESIYDFLKEHGSQQAAVHTNPVAFHELVEELSVIGTLTDNIALKWVQDMLIVQHMLRPTAALLVASITAASDGQGGHGVFCGICCLPREDEFSDGVDEFESFG